MPDSYQIRQVITWIAITLFGLIGGTGGIVYWYDRIRNRPRLKVYYFKEDFGDRDNIIHFEVENIGIVPTSLSPTIKLSAVSVKGKYQTYNFSVTSTDRSLPPHMPKKFEARIHNDPELSFLMLQTYTFTLTRGVKKKIYSIVTMRFPTSWWKYHIEKLVFMFRGLNKVAERNNKRRNKLSDSN